MPVYVFECQDCNVRFERNLKMGDHTSHECPACQEVAPRVLDGEGFGFSFVKGSGAPANSGVHDHDYPTADKAIGRSATERWAMLGARQQVKAEARKQGGTHALIRRTGRNYIDYEPMSDQGLDAHRRLTKAAVQAAKAARGSGPR
jgi:putative FmdB family regulatory protein